MILQQLKDDWLKKRSELSKKRPPRRYLHFDKPITVLRKSLADKITDPNHIKVHPFFPLISEPQSARVYRRDPITKLKKIIWKERPISYPSHFDSLVYSWYAFLIESTYEIRLKESGLNESVIAYRKLSKSNVDFAAEVFKHIVDMSNCSTIALDIKGFYDNLDFKILKSAWKENFGFSCLPDDHYQVYKSITNFSYVRRREISKVLKLNEGDYKKSTLFFNEDILNILRNGNKIKRNKVKGIPQGTPISCVLSNIYMFNFDLAIFSKVKSIGGIYRRYSDDIVIVCPKEFLSEVIKYAEDEINKLLLEIQKSKTEIRRFSIVKSRVVCVDDKNLASKLQYLGIEFDGVHTFIRHKSYARFERRMTKAIIRKKIYAERNKTPIFKKQIYESFSPLGKRNYISYSKSAISKLKDLSPEGISKQTETNMILKKINKKIRKV